MTICETAQSTSMPNPIPAALASAGVAISLRPRQRLSLGSSSDHVYIVRSGLILLEAFPQPDTRRILDLYYSGDVIRSRLVPDLNGSNLLAASQSDVIRLAVNRLDELLDRDANARRWIDCAFASQYPRRIAQLAVVGGLTGEERVVSLLVELALRVGEAGYADARTFDMPLSRTDMADYLSLNADTLSRIMSRLRQADVLGMAGRGRGYAPSFRALCSLTPIADTIRALHTARPPQP